MKFFHLLLLYFLLSFADARAQDTFSILAFDSISGEVGAAGASCVDLFNFPGYSDHFIAELFPGVGAIATQAAYLATNQLYARNRMNAGDSPKQIIQFMQNNDAGSDPTVRQYGVVRIMPDSVQAAAFTGSNCMTYKNHITGPNYSIQGNILLGQKVLDSMEARFKREKGDLACKLMAALQGAKQPGADSRCAGNNSSSLFAFVKTSLPGDVFGSPSFLVSLRTHSLAMIEPIDSLQKMFSAVHTCTNDWVGVKEQTAASNPFQIYPNPAGQCLNVQLPATPKGRLHIEIHNVLGLLVRDEFLEQTSPGLKIDTSELKEGLYLLNLHFSDGSGSQSKRFMKTIE
ncbi:MAG TPA: DUF1028 domain-containing protein [Bacteroidia bacterium]|nr:DUF1028 domain-containing protein [Bacteroidia bacterium]